MTRSQDAPLSPNEEITLRRVAYGQSEVTHLRTEDLIRLRSLDLIGGSPRLPTLTAEGKRRFDGLAKSMAIAAHSVPNEMMTEIGRLMARKPHR